MTRTRRKHQERQAQAEQGLPTSPVKHPRAGDVFVLDPQRDPRGGWQWPPADPLTWLRNRRNKNSPRRKKTLDT